MAGKYGTAEMRWAGVGPYYAMFPNSFAQHVINYYTDKGDFVLDPFSGRGTAPYCAAINGRIGIGIEINPVGWVYSKAKLYPAEQEAVMTRIEEIGQNAWRYRKAAERLPRFFHECYIQDVREFLLTARAWLNWRQCRVDWTVMAILLVHMHGKRSDSMSNQMRQTKSFSPPYAIRWWAERESSPPDVEPVEFLRKKLDWRYAKGLPTITLSQVYLGDSCSRLGTLSERVAAYGAKKSQLLLTSPPYCGVTNYHYDQWMRLWLLGCPEAPHAPEGANQGKFVDRAHYKALLEGVFERCAPLLKRNAVVYVRSDTRKVTLDITVEVLKKIFPKKRIWQRKRPLQSPSQTRLFGGKSTANGEVDIVLLP